MNNERKQQLVDLLMEYCMQYCYPQTFEKRRPVCYGCPFKTLSWKCHLEHVIDGVGDDIRGYYGKR